MPKHLTNATRADCAWTQLSSRSAMEMAGFLTCEWDPWNHQPQLQGWCSPRQYAPKTRASIAAGVAWLERYDLENHVPSIRGQSAKGC